MRYEIPIIARGKGIDDYTQAHKGRFGETFYTPDPKTYLPELVLKNRSEMGDLYNLSLDEVVNYLLELGSRLDLRTNPHLQWSLELNDVFSDNAKQISGHLYEAPLKQFFKRERIEDTIKTVGREYLDGWVPHKLWDGRTSYIRAIGVPTAHVIAGNAPLVVAITVVRNALVRGYAIVKIPSNELGAAVAIGRTMIDMAPDHPLTRAWTCAYWKGGDEAFEKEVYHPKNVDRIVAWGGFESVRHIAKYVRPGIDLVTFDPKVSRAIIGPEAFEDDATMQHVARRIADDVGQLNQVGCSSCRLVYAQSGTDAAGLAKIKKLAHLVFDSIQELPLDVSCPAHRFDPELRAQIDAARIIDEAYYVVGGDERGGAIVSLTGEEVDFAAKLAHRTVNLIPMDDLQPALKAINRDVQSIGVYPDRLLEELRLEVMLYGAQRLCKCGYMMSYELMATTHDGNEGLRRMATWVLVEDHGNKPIAQYLG